MGQVLSLDLYRWHLMPSQRAALAAEIADMKLGTRTNLEPGAESREVSASEAAEKLDQDAKIRFDISQTRIGHNTGAAVIEGYS